MVLQKLIKMRQLMEIELFDIKILNESDEI
jgi:hypothetical protein